jgi:hypothetical protein
MAVQSLPAAVQEESRILFDDTRVEDIDPEKHAPFIIARVLDRGTIRSVAALLRLYDRERIRDFLRNGGARQISRRTLALWKAFLNLSSEACIPKSSLQSRSEFWMD